MTSLVRIVSNLLISSIKDHSLEHKRERKLAKRIPFQNVRSWFKKMNYLPHHNTISMGIPHLWSQIMIKYHQILGFLCRLIISNWINHRSINRVAGINLMCSQMMKATSHRFINRAADINLMCSQMMKATSHRSINWVADINHTLMPLTIQENLRLHNHHSSTIRILQLTAMNM